MKLRIFLMSAIVGCFSFAQATVHNVSVGSNFFNPNSLSITAGDTVFWTNTGGFHNVDGSNAANPVTFTNGGASSASWTYQRQFNQIGTYNYVCTPHAPGMSGSIIVNAAALPPSNDLVITGVFDGPLTGGNPKGVELYVVNNISDLSTFGLGSANNGGGTDGQEFTFPAVAATAGDYIYVTTDTALFRIFFGFGAAYQDGSMAINGDDAVELFSNGSVGDVFGDINVDGSGQPWEYLDSWAYRVSGTGPDDSTFVLANWTFGGVNTFDNTTTNAAAVPPMPIGSYSTVAVVTSDLILTGIMDGTLPGGTPKVVELYATAAIADLSVYGVSRVSGSNGSIGQAAYVMPADAAVQGQRIYITNDSTGFFTFFGFNATYVDTNTSFNGVVGNGDDAYELYKNNTSVVDVFGDATKDGTGEPWEYTDSWAYRINGTGPDGNVFVLANWTFGGPNALDNETSNLTAVTPFPISTYSPIATAPTGGIPTYTIAQITTENATTAVADSIGTECKLVGFVATPNFRSSGSGVEFVLVDGSNTAGITVRNTSLNSYTPAMGDELRVIGTIAQFRGLTQLNIDSIVVISNVNTLPNATVETTLGENTEGRIVRLNNVTVVPSTIGNWSSGNVDVYSAAGDTSTVRFDSDFGAAWGTAPTGMFSVVGVGGQFSGSVSPFDNGYQLFPRIASDIILPTVIGAGGIPNYTLAQIIGLDANGVADSLNVDARITGVVFTDDFDGNAGYQFNIYDATGAITVFSFADVGTYAVTRGDSLRIIGSVAQFNGLTQFSPDSIVVLSQGATLKTPTVATRVTEANESDYIRLNGFSLVTPSQWPVSAGGSSNVDITDGTTTLTLRIDSDINLNGSPAPIGIFDVIGAAGQFDNSSPYFDGYQILPRDSADLILPVAATPTINFPLAAQNQLENAGSVTISLPIVPSATTAQLVKLYVANGANITAGDYTTTPAAVADTITLTAAANAANVSFSVNVIDDMLQEVDENISFTIAKVGAGLSIGAINTHVFTINDNDTPIPTYDIADIDGTNAQGEMDSVNVYCKIIATVTSPSLSASRTDFFITNATNTAGIKINQGTLIAYSANIGDQIRVVGTLSQFRGGIQISADSLTVLSSGNPILPTIQSPGSTIGEVEEGRVLRYNGVELLDTAGWPSANFGNFDMLLANGDTTTLRLDSDIPTVWGPAPLGKFDVIGVAGQFSSSNNAPFLDGYQLQPRTSTEIIVTLPKLAITEIMPNSNLSSPIGGDWFELTNYGTTPVFLTGFSWDDDSRTAGTHTIASLISQTINAGESVIFYDGLASEAVAWSQEWSQQGNNIVIYAADEFGPLGFSGLSSNGDEVNFYDDKGQLVARATYGASMVTPGISIEFDTTSSIIGQSTVGVRNAYTSANGDIGSPSNLNPISIAEFLVNSMELYPNPATSMVKLTSTNNAKKLVKITDLAGSLVHELNSTETSLEINVSNLPKGVYLIQVTVDEASATHKLIVQ